MTVAASSSVELPSGKDEAYENFPVGSWLLPAKLRPHIAAFYGFARTIDDIADSGSITADKKIDRLNGFEMAVKGQRMDDPAFDKAHRIRQSLDQTGVSVQHCLDLLTAFKQDAVKLRYDDWDDLMGYCQLSAAPVGRYLVDLHGGSTDGYGPSDALCNALQVLNHLQDIKDDYLTLDRVYLPEDWMAAHGVTIESLGADHGSPGLRAVINLALDGTADLLATARRLPRGLASRRLAMESQVIINIAEKLSKRLEVSDPLSRRVALTKPQYLLCCLTGLMGGLVAGK